jgi:hypothetical protein
MKTTLISTRLKLSSLSAVCTLSLALLTHTQANEEWLNFFPKDTIAIVNIANIEKTIQDFDSSSISRFLEDPDVKKWMAPMYKDGEAPWDTWAKENIGGSMREELSIYKGATTLAFAMDPEDPSNSPRLISIANASDNIDAIKEGKTRMIEARSRANTEIKLIETEIDGVSVSALGTSETDESTWTDLWAFSGDLIIESNSKEALSNTLAAVKGETSEPNTNLIQNLQRYHEVSDGTPDITLFINIEPLVALLTQKLAENNGEDGAGGMAAMFPPEMFLGAFRLDEFRAMGLSITVKEDATTTDFALLHAPNPQGFLLKSFRAPDTRVALPNFIPADVASAGISRWSILAFYDNLMAALNQLGPMVGGMVQMQLGQVEQQLGIKFRDDLFATLDSDFINVLTIPKTGGSAEEPPQSQVLGIKFKDSARFQSAFNAIKAMAGDGFSTFQESTFAGQTLWTMESEAQTISYAFTKDYLLFGFGTPDAMHKILNGLNEAPATSFWEDPKVQNSIQLLPAEYSGVSAADAGAVIISMVTTLSNIPGAADMLDSSAVPSEAVFKRYFGYSASGSYSLDDAIHGRSVIIPATNP